MTKITSSLSVATLLGLCLHVAPAHAQLSRTAVSAARGNDANNCDVATPCRSFQRAHDQTNSDGEITVLDPGGYGSLTITKSISVVNDGVGEASILVSGGAVGITINGGGAAYINLRGITIQGIGFGGGSGILFNSGFALTITHCVIRNHTSHGITFAPTAAAARLAVSDTLVADNGGHGILVNPAGAANNVKVDLDHVAMRNNSQTGAFLSGAPGGMHASIADSVVSGSGIDGIQVSGFPNAAATAVVTRSVLSNNAQTAVVASDNAFIGVGQSMISGNVQTWAAGGVGKVWSFGDNDVLGNFDGDLAMTVIAKK